MPELISRERAHIFRITHRDNIPWLMANGLYCRNADVHDPNFVSIGNAELVDKRHHRNVPCAPFGTLSDYVPFYFTPHSPMLYNISTGYGGIRKRSRDEIVIMISSIHSLASQGVPCVFTDRNAYLNAAQFFSDPSSLDQVDWELLRRRDFRRDPDDPEKMERYQAEALVHRYMPWGALTGLACHDDKSASLIRQMASDQGIKLQVVSRPGWYF
jgi:hypothetical protein